MNRFLAAKAAAEAIILDPLYSTHDQDENDTRANHLGVTHDVHTRNDITINRSMFIFSGYIFDRRLLYSATVWTSAGAASIVVAGNIGWRFNKALTLTGGYTGVPSSRSLVNTFPLLRAGKAVACIVVLAKTAGSAYVARLGFLRSIPKHSGNR
jgi:hypothetical protein